jgi:hypothetical protein
VKVWEVTENDTQVRLYWYETLKEARHHRAEFMRTRENLDHTCEISPVEFSGSAQAGPRRAAMKYVIEVTCFNEG